MAKRLFSDRSLCFYDPVVRDAPTTLAALRVGNFATIPNFIRGTDLLAVMPGMLQNATGYDQLANSPLPYEASWFNIYMLRHKKYQKDPQHQWFREVV